MQALAAVVGLATVVLGLVLGIRLLRLALRTRQAPELAMGLYCLLVTLGTLALAHAFQGLSEESAGRPPLSAAGTFLVGAGAFALAVGIRRIFRPAARAGAPLLALLGLGLLGSWLATALPGDPVTLADVTLANALFAAGRVAIYLWGAFEAFRYASMLDRRAAIGLADPVAAHQIRLWGTAWLAVMTIAVGSMVLSVTWGPSLAEQSWLGVAVGLLNLTAWTCTWLAFFPLALYQRRILGRSYEAAA